MCPASGDLGPGGLSVSACGSEQGLGELRVLRQACSLRVCQLTSRGLLGRVGPLGARIVEAYAAPAPAPHLRYVPTPYAQEKSQRKLH